MNSQLSTIGDVAKPAPTSASSREGSHDGRPGSEGVGGEGAAGATEYRPSQKSVERYRADHSAEGVEVLDGPVIRGEGGSVPPQAIAAANDVNLLRKYAETDAGKRPVPSNRIFAPTNGPLSGEPLRYQQSQGKHAGEREAHSDHEDFETLPNHTVGGLRLQHQHLASSVSRSASPGMRR